jgi:hypothetical protein
MGGLGGSGYKSRISKRNCASVRLVSETAASPTFVGFAAAFALAGLREALRRHLPRRHPSPRTAFRSRSCRAIIASYSSRVRVFTLRGPVRNGTVQPRLSIQPTARDDKHEGIPLRRVLIPEEAAPQFLDDAAPRNGMMPPPDSEMIAPPHNGMIPPGVICGLAGAAVGLIRSPLWQPQI